MGSPDILLSYIGPDVALPVASALAGVVGFLLMVGRAPFRLAARAYRKLTRGTPTPAPPARPPADSTPDVS